MGYRIFGTSGLPVPRARDHDVRPADGESRHRPTALILAAVTLEVLSLLLAQYPSDQRGARVFWIAVSLLLYLFVWRGGLWSWRTMVVLSAIGLAFLGAATLAMPFVPGVPMRAVAYAGELALLLQPPVRRWVAKPAHKPMGAL